MVSCRDYLGLGHWLCVHYIVPVLDIVNIGYSDIRNLIKTDMLQLRAGCHLVFIFVRNLNT